MKDNPISINEMAFSVLGKTIAKFKGPLQFRDEADSREFSYRFARLLSEFLNHPDVLDHNVMMDRCRPYRVKFSLGPETKDGELYKFSVGNRHFAMKTPHITSMQAGWEETMKFINDLDMSAICNLTIDRP